MIHVLLALVVGASFNPYRLDKPSKAKQVKMIVGYAEKHGQDPYELVAIALTESSLNPNARSWAGAVGLFQVMCKYWYQPLKYQTIQQCEVALFDPRKNVAAAVHVLTTYRKYFTQCKGSLAYRCYYAGQGWTRRTGKLKKQIERYEKKVLHKKAVLHKYYTDLIESIRSEVRNRS
jgi:soluble lytic murein transglycosylase-like protein